MPISPAPTSSLPPNVYQLKIVLRGVSPLIWRRLLVRNDSTIADLHAMMQLALGWSDEHLHRFVVHGKDYGSSQIGGSGFRDDLYRVRLAAFGLRPREQFLYEYDFTDGWQHDVRVEQVVPLEPGRRYPGVPGRPAGRPAGRLRWALGLRIAEPAACVA